MSSPTSPLLTSVDDLIAPFVEAQTPRSEFRIGAEAEKFGVFEDGGAPLPYEGETSVTSFLKAFAQKYGWKETPEVPGGPLIALARDGASITLEPGGQLELSGAALFDNHEICAEMSGHLAELREISAPLGVAWIGTGFHPWAKQEDLPWVPKRRYAIMRRYLPTRGRYALDMMRRTATVQANFDYPSEEAAMRMLRVGLKWSMIVAAMFANSPFYEGEPFGGRSYRTKVWSSVDPDRQGLLPRLWSDDGKIGYRDYVEWALDAPMFAVARPEGMLENTGQTFRSFLRHGFRGHRATMSDWNVHLNTMFPEVRLKRTIEVRGADSLPWRLACALPALWTGILYDDQALDAADRALPLSYEEANASRPTIAAEGVRALLAGRPVWEWGLELLDLADGGLARRARKNSAGKDETIYLRNLRELLTSQRSPADVLLDAWERASDEERSSAGARATILAATRL